MYSRGIFHNSGCFGYGFFSSGWNWLIVLGLIVVIGAVTYLLVKKNKRTMVNSSALESLKIKFAQGEVTEEEYTIRKKILSEK